MKAKWKLLGIVALAVIIGFTMAACGSDSSDSAELVETFRHSSQNGADYTLEIFRGGAARYTNEPNDWYVLNIAHDGQRFRSQGTVENFNQNTGVFTLRPLPLYNEGVTTFQPQFTIETSGNRITGLSENMAGDNGVVFTPPVADTAMVARPGSNGVVSGGGTGSSTGSARSKPAPASASQHRGPIRFLVGSMSMRLHCLT